MLKLISFIIISLISFFAVSSQTYAHGLLTTESKTVGNYKIEYAITADGSSIYEDYPLTYMFRLLSKDGKEDVPYDSAYVNFSKKDGDIIFGAEVTGPGDLSPGARLEAAMPDPGEYTVEIHFRLPKDATDKNENVTEKFNFMVQKNSDSLPVTEKKPFALPNYVWALLILIVGISFGRFGHKMFGFLKG